MRRKALQLRCGDYVSDTVLTGRSHRAQPLGHGGITGGQKAGAQLDLSADAFPCEHLVDIHYAVGALKAVTEAIRK
jgi:hypothetical protein